MRGSVGCQQIVPRHEFHACVLGDCVAVVADCDGGHAGGFAIGDYRGVGVGAAAVLGAWAAEWHRAFALGVAASGDGVFAVDRVWPARRGGWRWTGVSKTRQAPWARRRAACFAR